MAEGFAGLNCDGEEPAVRPCLPEGWTRLKFHFCRKGRWYLADLDRSEGKVIPLD